MKPNCPNITLTPITLSDGVKGYTYVTKVTASSTSGNTEFRYYVSSKLGLPDGLSLNGFNGQIYGKFLTAQTCTFTIAASSRDSSENTCIGEQEYTIEVTE